MQFKNKIGLLIDFVKNLSKAKRGSLNDNNIIICRNINFQKHNNKIIEID